MRPLVSIAARGLFLRVLAKVAIVVGTIEIVFLAEKATGVLEEVLGNGGRVPSALLILLMTSPEIFDFALALACVIGGYFAFSAAREERELVALSAAGVSWQLPLRVALALGVVAGVLSLAVSGFLDPLSKHATRSVVFELKSDLLFRRLTEPSDGTLIETIRGRTFAALSDTSVSPPHESLFVHQPGERGSWRVTQAGNWSLIGPDEEGSYDLGLGRVIAYDFVPVAEEGAPSVLNAGRGPNLRALGAGDMASVPMLPRVKVENVSMPVSLDNILRFAQRTDIAREWTLSEALERGRDGGKTGTEALEIAGERSARAIAAFVAPMLALVACALAAGGLAGFLALPLSCGALLVLDVGLRAFLAGVAVEQGGLAMLVTGGCIGLGLVVLLGLGLGRRAPALLRPVNERA